MSKEPKIHHLIALESSNVKRLKAVSIPMDRPVVEITGENGAGKTSVLDSVVFALGGKNEIQDVPIRQGEESATIVLTTEDLVIKRVFRAQENGNYTTTLVVETSDGLKATKPQDFLDAIIGDLSFDPLAFTRMKPKDQLDVLKRFVTNFDFDASAAARKKTFEARTDTNKRIASLKSQIASIVIPEGTPEQPIDIHALMSEMQAVGEHNTELERRIAQREQARVKVETLKTQQSRIMAEAEELRQRAKVLDLDAAEVGKQADELQAKLNAAEELPERKDASAIRAKIDEANAINIHVDHRVELDQLKTSLEAAEKQASDQTAEIKKIDDEKTEAIASANLPVPGLGFGDDTVTLDGLPFNQASSAQQLRAAVGMCMAANPKLRLVLIRDGALLDDKSMAIVAEMAAANDFTVLIETVASDRPGAIVIEDGEVRSVEVKEAAE